VPKENGLTGRVAAAQINTVIAAAMAGREPDGAALAAGVDRAFREANRVVLHGDHFQLFDARSEENSSSATPAPPR
jgi:hypothetical protein